VHSYGYLFKIEDCQFTIIEAARHLKVSRISAEFFFAKMPLAQDAAYGHPRQRRSGCHFTIAGSKTL